MAHKHHIDYFEMFVKIGEYAVSYSKALVSFLEERYDESEQRGVLKPQDALFELQELHQLEEASDEVTHEVISNLANEFVTPVDREDILELAEELDNVVDALDEVLQHMYMYCVSEFPGEVLEMAKVVHRVTEAMFVACQKLTYFKKSKSIQDYVVRIHDCEDEADVLYINAVHMVYERVLRDDGAASAVAFGIGGTLASLESCCDACEAVGNTITTILTKNS